jgi:hypothetical protein
MTEYSWTKLLLDQNSPLTRYDDAALEGASRSGILKLPEGKSAVEVVSDYLSDVYQHILTAIAKQITDETLAITPLEFWFTVPAIWSDQAQSAMRTAARTAGFGGRPGDNIFLISEPEAAAVAALRKYTTNSMGGSVRVSIRVLEHDKIPTNCKMQPGDGVLVCDCGGGTVVRLNTPLICHRKLTLQDITTYLVETTKPELTFGELCTGTGKPSNPVPVRR